MRVMMGREAIEIFEKQDLGTPYTLTVMNENPKFQSYALFQTIPDVVGASQSPLSLAWMIGNAASGSPENPSTSVFSWTIDYSISAGYIQELGSTLNPRAFATASKCDVMLEGLNNVAITYQGAFPNGAPAFPTNPTSGPAGVFLVRANNLIPSVLQQASVRMSLNVGLAMGGKPAVAVQLEPNLDYTFTPKPSYFIIAGSFIEGQVIDTAISSAAFPVQFAQGVTRKTIRFTQENQFVPA